MSLNVKRLKPEAGMYFTFQMRMFRLEKKNSSFPVFRLILEADNLLNKLLITSEDDNNLQRIFRING